MMDELGVGGEGRLRNRGRVWGMSGLGIQKTGKCNWGLIVFYCDGMN